MNGKIMKDISILICCWVMLLSQIFLENPIFRGDYNLNDFEIDSDSGNEPDSLIHELQTGLTNALESFSTQANPIRSPRPAGYFEDASNGLPKSRPGTASDSGWTGITFGNINKDANLDLVCIGRKGNGPEVFLGNGAGSWTKSNTGLTSSWSGRSDVRIVDINKDGNNDILSSDAGFWTGDGTGKWTSFSAPAFTGEDIDYGDFNNDTHLDVVIVGHLSGGIHAYFGDSNGNWVEKSNGLPTTEGGHKIAVGDVNNDGYDDIISTLWYSSGTWLSDGAGNWTHKCAGITLHAQHWGVDVGDINHDGFLDIVFGVYHNNASASLEGIRIYRGDGTGVWSLTGSGLPTTGTYGPVKLGDMDLDGNLDIVSGKNGGGGGVQLFLGDGNFSFTETDVGLPAITTEEQEGLGLGDIDNNGYLDVGIPYYGTTGVEVWRYIEPIPISLTLDSPNGGEKYKADSVCNISWHCSGGILPITINLECSTTGVNGEFYPITTIVDNTGYFEWVVARVNSKNCVIKITVTDSCKFQQNISDTSNNAFEIYVVPLNNLDMVPGSVVVHLTEETTISVRAFDTENDEILHGLSYTWSVTNGLGVFTPESGSGAVTFTATGYGSGQISVFVEYFDWSLSASISIIVPRVPSMIVFDHKWVNLSLGQKCTVETKVYDSDGVELTKEDKMSYTWEILGSYAKITKGVDSNSVTIESTSIASGELEVLIKYYGRELKGALEINVFSALGSILIEPGFIYTLVGKNTLLTLNLYNPTAQQIPSTQDTTVTWRVLGNIGRVTPTEYGNSAIFECTHIGTGRVEAEVNYYGDIFSNSTQIISVQMLDELRAEPNEAIVYCGDNYTFIITGFDETNEPISGKIDYTYKLLYKIGELFNNTKPGEVIFRPFAPGDTVILVTGEYFGSVATLQIKISVPPELTRLQLTPCNPVIVKDAAQVFLVNAYDSDDVGIVTNISYVWSVDGNIGSITELEIPNKVRFSSQVLGQGKVIVKVKHFTRLVIISTNITVMQKLEILKIKLDAEKVYKGSEVILTVEAYDDLGQIISDNIEFIWSTTKGEINSIDQKNSTIRFKTDKIGSVRISVKADYFNSDAEDSLELSIYEKDIGTEAFGNILMIVTILILVIIILLVLTFILVKRKNVKNDKDQISGAIKSPVLAIKRDIPSPVQPSADGVIDYSVPTPIIMQMPAPISGYMQQGQYTSSPAQSLFTYSPPQPQQQLQPDKPDDTQVLAPQLQTQNQPTMKDVQKI